MEQQGATPMALVEMTDALKVGYFAIDEQHKELFDIINELHEAIKEKRKKGDIDMGFTFLDNYIRAHFSLEESLMIKKSYPSIEEHKSQHVYFLDTFNKIKESFNANAEENIWGGLGELEDLLRDWFINHIMTIDKKLGEFVSSKVA